MKASNWFAIVCLVMLLASAAVEPAAAIDPTKAQPLIVTTAFPGATAGATGSLSFQLYGPDDTLCTGTPAPAGTRTLNGNGFYNSDNMTISVPGMYRWVATYSGDLNNNAAISPCNAPGETSVITQGQTAITTLATGTGSVGGTIQDSATTFFENGSSTGTLTFSLYGPDDATCSGAATAAGSVTTTFVDDGSYSSSVMTVLTAGTYRWIASFASSDIRTKSASTICNDPAEISVVTGMTTPPTSKAQPTVTTKIHKEPGHTAMTSVPAGSTVHDKLTVSGNADTMTGTIRPHHLSDRELERHAYRGTQVNLDGDLDGRGRVTLDSTGVAQPFFEKRPGLGR